MMKDKILEYIRETYNAEVEYLWASTPENGALRNPNNGKWFAVLIGNLPKYKLGVKSDETSDVLNLKCDPMLTCSFVDDKRIFKGYHMNKEHWISVLLDGSVAFDGICMLVNMSYELIEGKGIKR